MGATTRGCRPNRRRVTPMLICGALVALLGVAVAPVQSACTLGCGNVEGTDASELFKAGQTYTYNLETEMLVQLSGNDPQDTQAKIQAQVLVTAGANCERSLQVRKFTMWTRVGDQKTAPQKLTKEILADLERPIRFAMKGQKISKDICADAQDSTFSLNIKRGLASLLQGHPIERGVSQEYDVFGKCPISNSEVSGDSTKIFLKRKDLTKCEGREHFTATGLVRSVFNSGSDVKSTPIMSGDYILEQRVKTGQTHPESIQLTEYYEVGTVKSFLNVNMDSAMANSVKSKVISKLVFLSATGGKLADIKTPTLTGIRFEALPNGQASSMEVLKTTIKTMIDSGFSSSGNVQEFLAEQFLQLVRVMRDTKKDDLLTLFQQVKSGSVHDNRNLAKKLYFDALFRANSADSVEAISTLVAKQMDPTEQKLAYMSLQFAGQLNKASLQIIQKLLDFNPSYEAYLVTGTLINKYCEQFECTSSNLKPIMDKFANGLKCGGNINKKSEHQIIAILKGLKNSNQINMDTVLDKVYNCYQESVKIKRVRVQSVKTMSAAVCHTAKGRDILKSILKEKTIDPEFRIQAYLGLIKNCPNRELIEYLQGLFNHEETNQLIGFLRTHIQSLKMSTDPSRQELRSLVKDFDLSRHSMVGLDFRKTSFNYEQSYNLEALGVGGSLDSSVIFTKNGFLPRSMNFNFSAEVFGRDYNFLELELRQENLEQIGEKLFGPRGYFATKKNQDIVDDIEKSLDQVKTDTSLNVERFNYRRRRDAINLKEESSQFNQGLSNNDQDLNTDLDLDLSVNMFGTEVQFLALSECDLFKDASNDVVKTMTKMFNSALDQAKNWEKSIEAYHLLLDTEFEYPTGIGIPLKARSQVSMATKFGAKLKFDLRDFMFSSKPTNDLKFQIELSPSMSLAGQTGLYLDMGFQRLGLQLNGNLYSSVNGALDFKVQENGHKWNMDYRMKDKKQEFIKFDHKIIFVQQDKGSLPTETALKFHAKKKDFSTCFDQLYPHTGVTFCADYSLSMAENKVATGWTAMSNLISTPLNGPNRLGVWLEVDPEYNFQLLFQNTQTAEVNKMSAEFSMDCPHPQYKRLVKFRGEAGLSPKIYLKWAMESAIKTSSIEVGYNNDAKEVVLYAEAKDDNKAYQAKFGLAKSGGREYTPIFLIVYPGHTEKAIFGYTVDGKILVDQKGPTSIYSLQNIEIRKTRDGQKVADEPLLINGKIEFVPISFKVDIQTVKGGSRMNLKGALELNLPNILIDFKTDSNVQELNGEFYYNLKYEKNALIAQLLKVKQGNKKDYDVFISNTIEMDKAVLDGKKTDEFIGAVTKFEIKSSFTPIHPVVFDFIYGNEKNQKYQNGIKFKCSQIDFNSQFNLKRDDKMNYDLTYNINMNKFFVKVLSKVNSDGSTGDLATRNFVNKITLSNGFTFDLNGNFNQKLKSGDFDLAFENRLVDNTNKPQYKIAFTLKNAPKTLGWNLNVNILNQPTDVLIGKFNLKKEEQFTLEMVLRDLLQLNTEFKFTELKVGKDKMPTVKGDGFVLFKFPKVNNYQVKANTKFSVGEPNYDVNVEILYDFERDNSKKVIFDTSTVVKKNEYHTKNSLEILNDKYQLNGNYALTGDIDNGVLKFDGQVILPSARTFSADFNRKLNKKVIKDTDASFSGTVDLQLKDQNPALGVRTITINGKLNEFHAIAYKYDVGYKVELKNYDGSNIIFEPTVKSDKGTQLNLGLNVYGKMLPEKFTSSLAVKNELKSTSQINFDLNANYGKSVTLSSIGHFKFTPGGTNSDYKILTKVNVNSANLQKTVSQASSIAKFKSAEFNLQGKSNGKLNQNFEWHFINEATINGNSKYHANLDILGNAESFFNTKVSFLADPIEKTPFVLETSYLINKDIKLKSADDVQEESIYYKTAVYQFFKNGGEFSSKLNLRQNDEVKLYVNLNKQKSDLHTLIGQLTSTFPAFKNHKVVIEVRQFDASSLTSVKAGIAADYYNEDAPWFKTNLAIDTSPESPVFEASLDNVRVGVKSSIKFSSKINRDANQFYSELFLANFPLNKFNFHGKLDWSNYQLVPTSPLKMTVHVECANWDLQNFEMTVKGARAGNKANIEVTANNKGKNVIAGQLELAEGATSSVDKSVLLEGSGNLKWQGGAKRDLTFTLMRKKIGSSDQYMEFLLNGQVDKKNFLFEIKILEGTTIARHSICMDVDKKCTNIELKSDRKSVTFDHFEHEFIINFDVRPLGGIFEEYYNNFGLTFNTQKHGFEFSSDFNLFVESKQRKYQLSANSKNPATSIEVTYPGRKMAIEFVHRLPTIQKWEFDFGSSVWLNKLKDPNNKLEVRTFGNAVAKMDVQEYVTRFSSYVSHPKMKKVTIDGETVLDLSMANKRFFESTITFDVYQNPADKFVIKVLSNKEFVPSDLIRFDLNMKLVDGGKVTNMVNEEFFVSIKQGEMTFKVLVDYPEPKFLSFDMSISRPKYASKFEFGLTGQKLIDAGSTFDPKEKSVNLFFNLYHYGHGGHACVKATGKFVYYNQANIFIECDHLATFVADYDLNTAASVKLTNAKNKAELYWARVALDQKKFLETEYRINKPELQAISTQVNDQVQSTFVNFKEEFNKKWQKAHSDVKTKADHLQNKMPDITKLLEDYTQEGNVLYAEIQADPTLKHICDIIEKFANYAWKWTNEFIQIAFEYFSKVYKITREYGLSVLKNFEENLFPIIMDFVHALRRIGAEFVDTISSFLSRIIDEFSTFFGKYQEDINKIAKQVAEQLRELHAIIIKFTSQMRTELENIIDTFLNFVKQTVDVKMWLNRIGEILREYKIDAYVTQVSGELTRMVNTNKLLTPETRKFLDALIKYVTNHLTTLNVPNPDVEVAELKKLTGLFVDALSSIYKFAMQLFEQSKDDLSKKNFFTHFKGPTADISKWQELLRQNFITLPLMSPIGSIDGEVPNPVLKFKWSGFNYLTSAEFYKSWVTGDWSRLWELGRLSNWVPPYSYQAQIIDGAHFMTFDGFHYTFAVSSGAAGRANGEPEGCYFVLAADSTFANFTVIGTFNHDLTKKLNSIIILDGAKNMFELKSNDKVYYNNVARELPFHQELNIWRTYHGQTNIQLPAGLLISCERNLEVCSFTVNGFYKNKLRGLLGNANDERIDELQLQNGEYLDMTAPSYDPFYQNYQLKKFNQVCPKLVTTTGENVRAHHHHGSPECDSVFKPYPLLESFLPLHHNYLEACQHAVMLVPQKKLETACTIARGYIRKLTSEYGIPIRLPPICFETCKSTVGDFTTIKVNNKKLDLILLVDFNNTLYTELLPQVINEFKATLKSRDVSDINIDVIGYNQNWKYPVHLTNAGANPKFNYGKFLDENLKTMPLRSDMYFTVKRSAIANRILDDVWKLTERAETDLGQSSDAKAFQYATNYPFRADAHKLFFIFRSTPLKYNSNPVRTSVAAILNGYTAKRGIHMHLMAPVDDFTLTGSATNARNSKLVVGFNEKVVLQNNDAKKKASVGVTNLRGNVQYKSDIGTDMVLRNHDGNDFVFLAQNYESRNPKDRKVFVQTMVNAIGEQLPRWETTQMCHCGVEDGIYEAEQCLVKESQLLAQSPKAPQRRG